MKIELDLIEPPYVLEAKNPDGNRIRIDANSEIGGKGMGVRPTELLLMGLAGCSGIDILSILAKQKQSVTKFHVDVDGEKEKISTYSVFSKIHVHYHIDGTVDPCKAKHAVELSLGKYCSVSKMLEKTAEIRYSLTVNGNPLNS